MSTISTSYQNIQCKELSELCNTGKQVDLIDVRTPVEFREIHSAFARNVPLDSLNPQHVMESRTDPDEPLYVICRAGSRGTKACEMFVDAGYENIVNVDGGTLAWDAAGLPVVRGQEMMSLERQVRIAAGSLVVIGVGLSFLHPYFIGLSAFVGAGLVFAGVTDTCGMGMMLAKMPWNQVRDEQGASSTGQQSDSQGSGPACCGS